MTVELQVREPSSQLINAIYEVTNGFQKTTTAIDEAFRIGREEGFTDKEIGRLIREQMLSAGFNDRSIRRALPSTAKQTEKTNKNNVTEEYADKMSASDSESATGSQGEEVGIEHPANTMEREYEEELSEKNKAIEELKKEVRILREINPEDTKNPEQTKQIKESLEKTLEENEELKQIIERQAWNPKRPIPFILPKQYVPELIRDLNHSLNNDVQMFLCEDNKGRFLDWIVGYQSYTSELKRELAQRREELSLRNASKTRQEQV